MNTLNKLSAVTLSLALSAGASALEINIAEGYTTNAFSTSTREQGSAFTALSVKHAGRTEGRSHLQYSFSYNAEKHEVDEADIQDLRLRSRWVARSKIAGKSASVLITADGVMKRQSFIDQRTGAIATSRAGVPLTDRFAYNSGKLSVESILRFNRNNSISLFGYVEERNYVNDYSELSLESLDYRETGIQPSYRLKTEGGAYLRAFVYQKKREHKGLRNDDMRGRNVDSRLTYTLTGGGVLFNYPVSDNLTSSTYVQAYVAKDDFEGARDLRYWKLDTSLKWNLTGGRTMSLGLIHYGQAFENDRISRLDDELRIPGQRREGTTLSLSYESPFQIKNTEFLWNFSIEQTWLNNSDRSRSFETTTALVGLTYRL